MATPRKPRKTRAPAKPEAALDTASIAPESAQTDPQSKGELRKKEFVERVML
ncbi:hypothetical protein [Thioclava atlantica]|uniref:hypothetical protein n=1 Tax=Thioclava atlantica TaxID=1317124 RepID=UPI000A4FCF3D|nr:hypothetical protein [Thioclava atlantica]